MVSLQYGQPKRKHPTEMESWLDLTESIGRVPQKVSEQARAFNDRTLDVTSAAARAEVNGL